MIGLAGGVGAGKSAVAAAFAALGCVVSDSDRDAGGALETPGVRAELVRWWGDRVLTADGGIDRRVVAAIVFADPSQRARLEALIHPMVHRARAERVRSATIDGVRAVIVDAPLLFEAGVDDECDAVVFVDASRETRLARVRSRGWDEGELERRESAQWPLERKRAASDYVIANESDRRHLESEAARVLEDLARSPD